MNPGPKPPILAAETEDGRRVFAVEGIDGSQRLMTEEKIARFDPEDLAVLIEAVATLFERNMGWETGLTPLEHAAMRLETRVSADQARVATRRPPKPAKPPVRPVRAASTRPKRGRWNWPTRSRRTA